MLLNLHLLWALKSLQTASCFERFGTSGQVSSTPGRLMLLRFWGLPSQPKRHPTKATVYFLGGLDGFPYTGVGMKLRCLEELNFNLASAWLCKRTWELLEVTPTEFWKTPQESPRAS